MLVVPSLTLNSIGETGFNILSGREDAQGTSSAMAVAQGGNAGPKQEMPEFVRIGPFSVYPPQFYLQHGDSINLVVLYAPDSPGDHIENLILETAFQTRTNYQLKGTGCVLDLEATALDAMTLNFKENPLSVIYFKVTKPRSMATRKLRVRNNCGMKVQYHWSIYKNRFVEKISLVGEETHYTIEPLQGVFEGHAEQEFTVSFKPLHAESYFEYADLIVDDIPIQAVPDAPESLKTLLSPGIVGPTYLGSNTRYPSFPYLKFTLQGYGDSCEIIPDPSVAAFPADMLISKPYSTKLRLQNKSKSQVKFKVWLKGKTSSGFDVALISPKLQPDNPKNPTVYQGTFTDEFEEVEVTVLSKGIGTQRAYFVGEIEDGNPFAFEVFGHFTGPRVRIIEKTIDFGLVRTKSNYEFRLNVENLTEIEAEVLFKNVRNKALTFETLGPENNSKSLAIDLGVMGRRMSRALSKASSMISISKTSTISIEPEYKKLGPKEKISVLVTLKTAQPETVDENLEILTKFQGSQYIALHAEVQKPHLSLSRTTIDLGDTYAGLQYKVDAKHKCAVRIRNHGNLDAQFHVQRIIL